MRVRIALALVPALVLACAHPAHAGSTAAHSAERDNYSRQSAAWEYHNRMANGFWDTSWGGGGSIDVSGEWQIEKLAKSIGRTYRAIKQARSDAFAAKAPAMIVADDKAWADYREAARKRDPWVDVPAAIQGAGGALAVARAASPDGDPAIYERVFQRAVAMHLDTAAMEYAIWLQSRGPEGATRAIDVLANLCGTSGTLYPSQCTEAGLAYWGGYGARVDLSMVKEFARRALSANEGLIYQGDVFLSRYHMLQGLARSVSPKDMDETKRAIAHFTICLRDYKNPQCLVPLIEMMARQGVVLTTLDYAQAESLLTSDAEWIAYATALTGHGDVDYYARGKKIIDEIAARGDQVARTEQLNLAYRGLPAEQRCRMLSQLEALASDGSPLAMRLIGEMKDAGACMPKDAAAATALYAQAAALDPQAKGILAVRIWEGMGVLRDRDRALELLAEAAEAGDRESLYNLGNLYWIGNYVGMDHEEARPYLERAAAMGDARAAGMLAKALRP